MYAGFSAVPSLPFKNPEIFISAPIPHQQEDEYKELAWGIMNYGDNFEKFCINRPKVGAHDVRFDVKFCGICHTDVHIALNHFGGTMYPIVPGHELVGIVKEVGPSVTRVAVGGQVAVGCTVDCCMECSMCKAGEENYCSKGGHTHTYNSEKRHGHIGGNQETQTFGGYSYSEVVHERFIVIIPEGMPLAKAAPLVCAGITMWDPLRHWGATTTDKKLNIGVAGVGGLGTMGIKLAAALGHRVVAISRSDKKKELAIGKGAEDYVATSDYKSVNAAAGSLDLILDTIPVAHDLQPYIDMLATNGTLVQLGNFSPIEIKPSSLIYQRKSISGSLVGGLPAIQEVVDFCFKKNIYPDIELVDSTQLDKVFIKLEKENAGGLRYVLDIEESKNVIL